MLFCSIDIFLYSADIIFILLLILLYFLNSLLVYICLISDTHRTHTLLLRCTLLLYNLHAYITIYNIILYIYYLVRGASRAFRTRTDRRHPLHRHTSCFYFVTERARCCTWWPYVYTHTHTHTRRTSMPLSRITCLKVSWRNSKMRILRDLSMFVPRTNKWAFFFFIIAWAKYYIRVHYNLFYL